MFNLHGVEEEEAGFVRRSINLDQVFTERFL